MGWGDEIKFFNTLFQPMLNYCRKFEDVKFNIFEDMILQSRCIFWGHLVLPYLSMLVLGEIKRLDSESFSKLTSFRLIFRSVSFWFNIKSTAFWSILKTYLSQPQFQSWLISNSCSKAAWIKSYLTHSQICLILVHSQICLILVQFS